MPRAPSRVGPQQGPAQATLWFAPDAGQRPGYMDGRALLRLSWAMDCDDGEAAAAAARRATVAFATLPDAAKWILAGGMLLGRLEIITVLVLCMPAFWRH